MTTVAGRFELGDLLGSGGVAEVWRARDAVTGQQVALKQLLPQFAADRPTCRRFLREAEVVRRLDHPGIVQVREAGESDGRPYLVMDLVAGEDLRRRLDREGALSHDDSWRIALAVAEALSHAHARGVVHRDIKPQNVLLAGRGREAHRLRNGAGRVAGGDDRIEPRLGLARVHGARSCSATGGSIRAPISTASACCSSRWCRVASPGRRGARSGGCSRRAGSAEPLPSLGQGEALDRLVASLLSTSPDERPSSAAEVIAVLRGEAPAVALVRTVRCDGCGEARPEDIPRCPACGREAALAPRAGGGKWRVVVTDVREDADSMAALTRLVGDLTGRSNLDLKFRTGRQELYSDEEKRGSIGLPALFFANLDEATAKGIAAALTDTGVRAIATPRRLEHRVMRTRDKLIIAGARARIPLLWSLRLPHDAGHAYRAQPSSCSALMPTWCSASRWPSGREASRSAAADSACAPRSSRAGRSPAVCWPRGHARALRSRRPRPARSSPRRTCALYRLTRRAEELARPDAPRSSEEALARRLVDAAPAINARLESSARRLAALDAALDGESEGDTARALAALARRAAAAEPEERPALDDARRTLEAALERRQTAETEREQLAAALCRTLAGLRDTWRRAAASTTSSERELAEIEAALRARLRAPPGCYP